MNALLDSPSSQRWFVRYKLYHLPFWLGYHYLWWVVALGNPVQVFSSLLELPYTIKFGFYVLFQAGAVYVNVYILIPAYLAKNRFTPYLTYLLLTMILASLCIVSGYYLSSYVSGRTLDSLYGAGAETNSFSRFFSGALPSTVASMTLAMSIKLTRHWIQTRQRQQLLEKEKLEIEVTFLKNQFNPHFLFNTINSIFFLIHKNPDVASASLATFSELLRYQLYECNETLIPLSREMAYLDGFVQLERLRQNPNVRVQVETIPAYPATMGIAPFVILTFIENAFKHVSKHRDQPNWISIRLGLAGEQLDVLVANSTAPDATGEVIHHGGIGLRNVQRRLDLLYTGRHQLTIQSDPHQFTVDLRLMLTQLVPTPTRQTA